MCFLGVHDHFLMKQFNYLSMKLVFNFRKTFMKGKNYVYYVFVSGQISGTSIHGHE